MRDVGLSDGTDVVEVEFAGVDAGEVVDVAGDPLCAGDEHPVKKITRNAIADSTAHRPWFTPEPAPSRMRPSRLRI
jgi:hypothetical protein